MMMMMTIGIFVQFDVINLQVMVLRVSGFPENWRRKAVLS
jgi:hypothetical protein